VDSSRRLAIAATKEAAAVASPSAAASRARARSRSAGRGLRRGAGAFGAFGGPDDHGDGLAADLRGVGGVGEGVERV
jgi:hypothetical protein